MWPPIVGDQPGHLPDVGDGVHRRERQPDERREDVEDKEAAVDQEGQSRTHNQEGRDEEGRRQTLQRLTRRTFAQEGRRSHLVADEFLADAAHHDGERTKKQYPDKDVDRQQTSRVGGRHRHRQN
jgi:hypothetical protein